jgi:hypothetical protein
MDPSSFNQPQAPTPGPAPLYGNAPTPIPYAGDAANTNLNGAINASLGFPPQQPAAPNPTNPYSSMANMAAMPANAAPQQGGALPPNPFAPAGIAGTPMPLPPAVPHRGNVPLAGAAPQGQAPAPAGAHVGTGSKAAAGAPTPPRTNPNSTQNMLQIAEIRDGIVIMNDGSYRSVVMVKSINFDLMSRAEQEAVEYSYQAFLNSLYFPMQIFVRSQKVDLQPYIEKLDKIRSEHDNMLLAMLMDDYIDYIDQLGQQTNIMDKKFYIVIPYFPHMDVQKALSQSKNFVTGVVSLFNSKEQHVVINEADLEKGKTELRNRVQAVLSGLLQCGVQGLPLDTQELIELYYDTYNPDTATRQQLKNFNNLNADIITKGEGAVAQPHLQRELT